MFEKKRVNPKWVNQRKAGAILQDLTDTKDTKNGFAAAFPLL